MSDLSFTVGTSGLLLLAVALVVIGIILFFKSKFRSSTNSDLAQKYEGTQWASPLKSRTKYPDVNAFNLRTPLILTGLVAALASVVFAFSATSYDADVEIPENALELDEDFLVEPPRLSLIHI